ncbi:hypothetical protein M758_3G141700 [Ceratodon purpureus]|nr:hypothetical protein M758_3G141700 [Ceratodon purpureus]
MPQVSKSRPPSGSGRGRKRKLLEGEPVVDAEVGDGGQGELWVEKHAPKTVSDLVVHGKKVGDVRRWLESRLQDPGWRLPGGQLLLLTGPPGVGKSAVVCMLGKELGLEYFEWKTPTPTQWQEHVHHGFTGHRYTSKLDEFEAFVDSARKFPVLPVGSCGSSGRKVKVLLIEDLPHVNDAAQTQQLCRILHELVRSVCFITVVVMTDVSEDGGGRNMRLWGLREAQQTLEAAGATKIVFNPVTPNSIKRLLTKIAATEKCRLSGDYISAIAENCGGDLRHAMSSLQFQCTGHKLRSTKEKESFEFGNARKSALDDNVIRGSDFEAGTSSSPTYGRDNIFSLYHALGKFLHNKRHTDQPLEASQESLLILSERYKRHPLNMEVPERILSEAQIEFSTLAAFLHENVLDFVDEEAVDDVADIFTYLGDADILLSRRPRGSSSSSSLNDISSSHIAALAAGSVAARGVLFANTHPAPRKWQSVRAPTLWQVERLLSEKKDSTMSRLQATRVPVGAALPSQLSSEVPSRCTPDSPPEEEDEPMDDIRSLTADCIVDLDTLEDLDDDLPHSNTQEQMHVLDRGPSNGFLEDDMEEDEDVIEDDDDD